MTDAAHELLQNSTVQAGSSGGQLSELIEGPITL